MKHRFLDFILIAFIKRLYMLIFSNVKVLIYLSNTHTQIYLIAEVLMNVIVKDAQEFLF